jgi:hypothetical protein
MHDVRGHLTAKGFASVERGKGLLARMVAAVFGFPETGNEIPVTVKFTVESGLERWTRTFGSKSFSSTQALGTGREEHLIRESFGPFHVGLAIVLDDGRLRVIPRTWSFLGIPLPRALLPQGASYEHAANGRFNFHVEIASPLTDLIVAYRGWLVPDP